MSSIILGSHKILNFPEQLQLVCGIYFKNMSKPPETEISLKFFFFFFNVVFVMLNSATVNLYTSQVEYMICIKPVWR